MEEKRTGPGIDEASQTAKFDYIKSAHFRVCYVDGAFGGIGPRGNIQMAVWNERWPIPKQVTNKLGPEGNLGDEIREERISRDAIVREVETLLILNVNAAKSLRDWLTNKIEEFEKIQIEKTTVRQTGGQ